MIPQTKADQVVGEILGFICALLFVASIIAGVFFLFHPPSN